MTLTLESSALYLGQPISDVLAVSPFNEWGFDRSVDSDLPRPVIDYVFDNKSVEIGCDENERVRVIFYRDTESSEANNGILDIPFATTRAEFIESLGEPTKSGKARFDSILGRYGPWIRYDGPDYATHIQFYPDKDRVKQFTLMRADVAP